MIEYINTIAQAWWVWASAMFWQVGLLMVVIACIDLVIRTWAWPQLRYALWSLVLIKLLLPPTLAMPTGLAQRWVPWVGQMSRMAADHGHERDTVAIRQGTAAWAKVHPAPGPTPTVPGGLSMDDKGQARAVGPTASSITVERLPVEVSEIQLAGPRLDWRAYAMGLWLAGAIVLGAFLVIRLCSLSKGALCEPAEPFVPKSFYDQMHLCADRLGLRRLPRVAPTQRLSSPAVFGVVRPVLLMPVGYLSRLSRRDTEHMLLHELAHIKRGDLLMHGLYLVLQILYWYNPLLWLVRRRVHHLRELCCDATVAELLREDTPAYRQTLLETARRFLAVRSEPGLGLLGLFEDSNLLLTRLNSLEKPLWRYRKMKRTIVVTLMGLMLACVLPMAQAQSEAASKPSDTPATDQSAEAKPGDAVVTHQGPDSFSQEMDRLRQQMEQLQQQMQQLAKQMAELGTERANLARQNATGKGLTKTHAVQQGDSLAKVTEKLTAPDKHRADSNAVEATVEGEYAVKSVKPGTLLEIQNQVGSVAITGTSQSDCTIKTVITARAKTKEQAEEMARKVQIRVTPTGDVVRIGADIPEDLRHDDGEGIQVSFELTVPEQVRVQVAQQVGDIRLSSLGGDVEAKTNVGAIRASALKGDAALRTQVGDIDLAVPAGASAKVNARTGVGTVTSDLPLNVTGTAIVQGGDVKTALGSSATGTLGDGRHKVDLRSQVGAIRIRSGSSASTLPRP